MTPSHRVLLAALVVAAAQATNFAGEQFLEENAQKEGVVTLESGLQYKVLKSGPEGAPSPQVDTPCDCHYTGRLITGEKFDSSIDRGEPTRFAPNQVIKGWTEALQLMKEGDKWELFIPSELAYGENSAGSVITPGSALLFELELVKVHSGESASSVIYQFTSAMNNRLFKVPAPVNFNVCLWHVLLVYFVWTLWSGFTAGFGNSSDGRMVQASHILIKGTGADSLAAITAIKADLDKEAGSGDPERLAKAFAAKAEAKSACPSSARGGSLGRFAPGQMVQEFNDVCFGDSPVQTVQGPVKTTFGYHLIFVHSRTGSKKED